MLHFIISIIIAILLFSVAFGFVAKVFSLSDQAADSFTDLAKEANDFGKSTKDKSSKLLILDVGTIVVAFVPGERIFMYKEYIDPQAPDDEGFTFNYFFPQPQECNNKPCLCLCREYKSIRADQGQEGYYIYHYDIQCNKLQCKETSDLAQSWFTRRTSQDPRRVIVKFTKENDKIKLK